MTDLTGDQSIKWGDGTERHQKIRWEIHGSLILYIIIILHNYELPQYTVLHLYFRLYVNIFFNWF